MMAAVVNVFHAQLVNIQIQPILLLVLIALPDFTLLLPECQLVLIVLLVVQILIPHQPPAPPAILVDISKIINRLVLNAPLVPLNLPTALRAAASAISVNIRKILVLYFAQNAQQANRPT